MAISRSNAEESSARGSLDDGKCKSAKLQSTMTSCDGYVEAGLTKNKTIQFLIQNLISMGCKPPEGFIECLDCEGKPVSGGFGMLQEEIIQSKNTNDVDRINNNPEQRINQPARNKKPDCTRLSEDIIDQFQRDREGTSKLSLRPEIYLCEDNVTGQKHANTIITHELIHAIDMCRAKMDPLRNCMHLACTEIRAENLSGECNMSWEFLRGKLEGGTSLFGHGKNCVRRRAIDSVRANPNCNSRAELYVDAAMERCYADTFPFERHPNQA